MCACGGKGEGGERVLPPLCGACHQSVESFELRQSVARVTPSANTRSFAVAADGVFSPHIIGAEGLSSVRSIRLKERVTRASRGCLDVHIAL